MFPVGYQVGDFYTFYISATNLQGTINSHISNPIQLAGIPSTPTLAPIRDSTYSSDTQITVKYNAVINNGGSSLVSYELQMGSLELDDFVSISGIDPWTLSLTITITHGIISG